MWLIVNFFYNLLFFVLCKGFVVKDNFFVVIVVFIEVNCLFFKVNIFYGLDYYL